jgi:hypothetical protein
LQAARKEQCDGHVVLGILDMEMTARTRGRSARQEESDRQARLRPSRGAAQVRDGAGLPVLEPQAARRIDRDLEPASCLDRLDDVAGERAEREGQVPGVAQHVEPDAVRSRERDLLAGERRPGVA